MISIEVAFATPNLQKVISLAVADNLSIPQAIALSKINDFFPEYDLNSMPVGIFAKRCFDPHSYQLQNGDRIEIYRSLNKTPNQKRIERAKKT